MKTMKNSFVKMFLAIAFVLVAALCLPFALMVAPVQVSATETTFVMVDGASVRYVEDDMTAEQTGIRFTARISATEYESLTADAKEVETGTFIMKATYETAFGEINEDNCFGLSAIYYWGDDTVPSGMHRIRCAVGNARLVVEDEAYEIRGSVTSILDANLNMKFIGRSYIKVVDAEDAVHYYFAAQTATNARSVVEVAQNGINGGATGSELDALNGYMDRYLELNDGSVSVNYTERYKVLTPSGLTLDASMDAVKSGTGTAANSSATIAAKSGYRTIKGFDGYNFSGTYYDRANDRYVASDKASNRTATLGVTGNTVLTANLEKNNNNVIFDAELNVGLDYTANHGYQYYINDESGSIKTDKSTAWSWDGTQCVYRSGAANVITGFYNASYTLPFPTNLFSLAFYSDRAITITVTIRGFTTEMSVITEENVNITLPLGASKQYISTTKTFRTVTGMFISGSGSTVVDIAFDNFCWEDPISVNNTHGNIALTGGATEYVINTLSSTVLAADEFSGTTVRYKGVLDVADEDNEWVTVTPVAGEYVIPVVDYCSYKVEVAAEGSLSVSNTFWLIGDQNAQVIASFEDGENSATFTNQYNAGTIYNLCSVSSDWSVTGSKSMLITRNAGNTWWCGPKFDTAVTASGTFNYISFWMLLTNAALRDNVQQDIIFYTDNGTISVTFTMRAGMHKYTFALNKTFTELRGIEFIPMYAYNGYIDSITVGTDGIVYPETTVFEKAGTLYTLDAPHFHGSYATAEYRAKGDSGWTALSIVDGKVQVTFPAPGDYEMRYTIEEEVKTINVVCGKTDVISFEKFADGTWQGTSSTLVNNYASFTADNNYKVDGNYSLKITPSRNGWDGFNFAADGREVELSKDCNTVSMYIYKGSGTLGTDFNIYFYGRNANGDNVTAHFGNQDINGASSDFVLYTWTLNSAIKTITSIQIRIGGNNNYNPIYIDCVTFGSSSDDGAGVVMFPLLPVTYNVNEAISVNLPVSADYNTTYSAQIKASDAADWTNLTVSGNQAHFTLAALGDYSLKLSATVNSTSYTKTYSIKGSRVFTFEEISSGVYDGVGSSKYTANESNSAVIGVSTDWSYGGDYSLKIKCNGNSWQGYNYSTAVDLGMTCNTVEFWIKNNIAYTNKKLDLKVGGSWLEATFTVSSGVTHVVLKYNTTFSNFSCFCFEVKGTDGTFYIDNLTFSYTA